MGKDKANAKAVSGKLGGDLLRHTKGSAAIGGASAAAALRAAAVGAAGETAKQMMEVLVSRDFGDRRPSVGDGWEIASALSLWADSSLVLLPGYVSEMGRAGVDDVVLVDFKDAQATLDKINYWTSEWTKGKIGKILSRLSREDRLVITSATCFKAEWASKFDPANTKNEMFETTSGGRPARMMRQECRGLYGETEMFVSAAFPFRGGRFSMLVIVPRGMRELAVVETDPAAAILMARARLSPEDEISVRLPRFKAGSSLDLTEPLRGMGMRDAFSQGDADFSGMTGGRDLYVSRIAHQAIVEVDEAGAEAAAATAVVHTMRSISRVPEIRADRTFLFAIRDEVDGEDLFVGRYDG